MAGTDFAVNFGAGLVVNIVTTVGRQARYCYQFNEFVTDLGDEQENLISTRDGIQRQLNKDKANNKEPSVDLKLQLKASNYLIDKVEKLKKEAEAKRSCCHGVCPNWICRYFVGKKAEQKMKAMQQLNEKLRHKMLSAHRLSLRYMLPSDDFILFKCTKEARNKILTALKDNENCKIGLSGMGGCGKTSLLTEVHKELQDSKLYKTAFAVVSNPPNYQAIQDSIANWMGLVFETEKNVHDRAARLSMAFEEDKKYLIFLDDVWEVLDFKAIGIPISENCKVLLSTRQQHILELMDFKPIIYMSLLTVEEAWELFQKHAGEIKEPFEQVAREITDECHRLPVAIKAVASTLRGKEHFAWTEALETLKDRRRPLNIEKGLEDPYRCLKFSFDELKDPEEVSLFLLCALFPNDSKIAIEVLIRFAFGLGIFLDATSYQRARSIVRTTIHKFKKYCLLLQEGQHVKLHDMFHALALWEAKQKTQVIMGPRHIVDLTKADYMKDTNRLYCHGIEEFPDQLNCPELEILIVSNNSGNSSKFPDMYFKEMMKLKVLAINNTSTGTKPEIFLHQLTEGPEKLRALCLRGWTLINICVFEKLVMLGTIELLDCVMEELPKELGNLKALKLLQVANCTIGGNPYKVLATCSHLEELYFVENHLPEMVQIGKNVPGFFHQIGSFKELQRYHLELGGSINTFKDDSMSKLISINNFDSSITNETFQALPQTLEVLLLEKVQVDCKSIIPDLFPIQGECLNKLKEFVLRDSDCIKYLIDTSNDQLHQTRIFFAKLHKLKVESMQCLEALCYGPPPSGLFEKLKELLITKCSQLASLFMTTTAQKMVMLEVLKVIDCGKLRHIIKIEKNYEDILVRPMLPKLKQISVKRCKNLKFILPISFASGLLHLERLEIEDVAKLQYVFGKSNHGKDQTQNQISIDLSAVKIFKLIDLPIILSICPQNYDMKLPLDKPVVIGCPRLSGIFDLDSKLREQEGDEALKQAQLLPMSSGEDFRDGIGRNFMDASSRKDHFDSLVRSLHKEKHKLLAKIRECEANTIVRSGDLQQLVKEAQELIFKVEKLEGKAKTSKSYCSWVCPKWINQYNLSKHFTRMTEELKQLNKRLASVSLTQMITYSSSGTFILFESRRMVYENLLTAVKDNKINMIGLSGMGGCGKTFLSLEICKVAENLKLFDKVVFVTVSSDPNITTIQDEIASGISLRFESGEDKSERAARLYKKLSSGKKFLIVLDDIWEVLKLEDVGIPFGENCKLILTTRARHICTMMDCQQDIYLSILTEKESWALFQTHVVIAEDTFKDLSLEFTKECQGLPITIVSVARSLKHKPEVVWKEALEELKGNYASDIDDTMVNSLCLRLCIQYLLSDELRSLLLLCSIFPEGSNIPLKVLIKFAYGLRIFEDVDSYASARRKVGAAIGCLVDSGWLLAREGGYIHMHDLVCDVALWVARKTHVIIRQEMDPRAFLRRISLKITGLYCYNICESLYQFTDEFFQQMRELKVLAILNKFARGDLNLLLPRSIVMLRHLRTLCLNGWILGDISILGEMMMLETIELLSCVIEELPIELTGLKQLKSLEVSRCSMGPNPFEVLAEYFQLEELYFVGNHLDDDTMGSDSFYALHFIDRICSSEILQRYHLEIGTSRFTLENDLSSKFLSLNDFCFDSLSSRTLCQNILARKLEVFYLNNVKGYLSSIVPDLIPAEGECTNELIEFSLSKSHNIIFLMQLSSHDTTVFSKLHTLRIVDNDGLKALCHGQPPSGLFKKLDELLITGCKRLSFIVYSDMLNLCNLRYLQLRDCCSLEYLFTHCTAQTMISLEVLKVKDCRLLEYIVTFKGEDDIFSTTVMFPKLREVSIAGCDVRYIGPASFAIGLSKLEILKIKDAPQLEYVFGEYNDSIVQSLNIDLPALGVFKLTNLPEITSIAPENCNISCPSLARLHIKGCPNLISMSGLDLKESQQSDDEATKQDLVPPTQLSRPMIEPAANTESNSEPEGLPQDYKSPSKQEERCHDDYAVDKDEKEAGQIPEDNNRELHKGSLEIEKGSFHNNLALEESKEGTSTLELIEKQPNVEPQLPLVLEDQQETLEEYKAENLHEVQVAAEVHSQSQKLDVIDESQEGFQEHNPNPIDSVNLGESNTKIAKVSLHKHSALEESTVGTSSEVLIDKQPQIMKDPQQSLQEYKVFLPLLEHPAMLLPCSTSITTISPTLAEPVSSSKQQHQIVEESADFRLMKQHAHHQEILPEDTHNEVQGASDDAGFEIHNSLQEKHLYAVGSINSRESSSKIVKGSLHKDPALEESTMESSSQVKIELSQIAVDPQQVLEEYKVSLPLPLDRTMLSPSTCITTTSSSTNQHPLSEEFVDFHGLFKIKETRARLLEEAFVKYPHLWEWKLSQKTLRICKVGYKSLADMLAFLKSETPKTMNDSKMEEFENLYYEVEYFGFNKMWLTSIRQRVMDMQADHNNKLKQLDQLESQISSLEEQLSIVKDNLSKPAHVFGF
ncbi:hypothetical protein QN277_006046 [Acacia crassicarpa]|uniref:AAA+ ATPase domain-containing protein n=1 Tax=Acacia crassicarpa TaxID=499986 RepID=A0AAE1JY89_9FABA|nr:hypothetical protein QN277_006046 [Acacia crassicarpa]